MNLPPPLRRSQPLGAKEIAAYAALVAALSGAVELRVRVGIMSDQINRIEQRLDRQESSKKYAARSD